MKSEAEFGIGGWWGSPPLLLIDSSQLPTAPGEGNRNQIYVKLSFTFCFALTYPIVLLLLYMAYIGQNIFCLCFFVV